MPLLDIETPSRNEQIVALAKGSKRAARDTYEYCVRRYNAAYDALWHRAGWTVADAQAFLDAMGPGVSAEAFQANYALGSFLNTVKSGTIPAERLAPPASVPYTSEVIEITPQVGEEGDENYAPAVNGYRIVLDENGTYPGPLTS